MDLDLSEHQIMLEDTVRGLCMKECDLSYVRRVEADPGLFLSFWDSLSALGLAGLRVSEDHGGSDLGLVDLAVVCAGLGAALAPGPYVESSVHAAAILGAISAPCAAVLLHGVADGSRPIVPAAHESIEPFASAQAACRFEGSDTGGTLSGAKSYVAYAEHTTQFIIMAKDSAGMSILCLVDADAPGLGIVPQTNLADMPLFLLTFTTAPVAAVLAKGEEAEAAWARGIDEVLVATAALAAGGAGRILDLTLAYARERKQFGQAIGGFQSIAHYLADAAVQVAGARTVTYRAAAEADRGVDARYFALMAKAKACAVYCDVSALAIQIFGGMGFTMEADPQLFYRRAKHLALMNGAPDWLEDGVADLLFDETKRIYS